MLSLVTVAHLVPVLISGRLSLSEAAAVVLLEEAFRAVPVRLVVVALTLPLGDQLMMQARVLLVEIILRGVQAREVAARALLAVLFLPVLVALEEWEYLTRCMTELHVSTAVVVEVVVLLPVALAVMVAAVKAN